MKKTLWMLGVAVAALTSCTESEVLDVPESRVIGFDTHVDKPTRAVDDVLDSETASFKVFYVYCQKGIKNANTQSFEPEQSFVLNEAKVTGGKGNWTYDPHATWTQNKTFRFAAYANGNATENSEDAKLNNVTFKPGTTAGEKDWGLTIDDYTVGENDLVVAIPEEKNIEEITTAPGSVGLLFKHILAKVEFRFIYVNGTAGETLEIEPFGFEASTVGDCETHYTGNEDEIGATWTPIPITNDEVLEYKYFEGTGVLASGNIHDVHYVIPQLNVGLFVPEITIKTKNANNEITDTRTFTNVQLQIASHTSWLPGYVYRYQAELSPNKHYIHFTTSVKRWIDEDNRNQTIENGPAAGNQGSGS